MAIALVIITLTGVVLVFIKNPIVTPNIGVYYYSWYTDDWDVYHTNCPDAPYLGRYNSANLSVIVHHLNWLKQLDINFVILSWWGKDSLSDNNTKLFLSQIVKNYTDIQFFIMVEP